MAIQRIDPQNQGPNRGFIPAIRTGNIVFISGQVGKDNTGSVVGPDISSQTRQTFENIKGILQLCQADLENIVKLTVFLTQTEDMDSFRKIRAEYFNSPALPTSTLVVVSALAQPELKVEVEAIADLGN
jgi:enamine deaminase RidA (YjgF/YER057c/UK114 family)|tara:strand:- start:80 stop:466 length:387 start_codon:yes stop_codon:yes gene_type:complete